MIISLSWRRVRRSCEITNDTAWHATSLQLSGPSAVTQLIALSSERALRLDPSALCHQFVASLLGDHVLI